MKLAEAQAALPHFEQYAAPWALHEPRLRALLEHVRGLDLVRHAADYQAARAAGAVADPADPGYAVTAAGVGLVEVRGALTKYGSSLSGAPSMVALRRAIRSAANDAAVGAIALVIDSPGGSVYGLDDLALEVADAARAKPVLAYVEDLAASAAYYVASQASRIVAGPAALVGSIGTYMVIEDSSGAAADAGFIVHVVKSGALKGAGEPGTAITDAQLGAWQQEVDAYAARFQSMVAAGRKLDPARVAELATGAVWMAPAALALGLIDEIGGLDAALASLAAVSPVRTVSAKKELRMEPRDTNPAAPAEPAAATLAQLRAALPGAGAEFLLDCLDRNLTVADAQAGWTQKLAADNAALTAQLAALEANLAQAQTAAVDRRDLTVGAAVEGAGDPWDRDADLRAEFGGKKDVYEAFRRATAAGRVRGAQVA